MQRVETFPVSQLAFREAIINAIVHKDYSEETPIQISVYDDKLLIYNSAELPEGWSVETLLSKHSSKPFNPDIANVFFLAGYIESWGRGVEKIIAESKSFNGIEPQFKYDGGLWIAFYFKNYGKNLGDRVGEKVGEKVGENLTQNQIQILENIRSNNKISAAKLSEIIGISSRKIEENIRKLKQRGLLKRTGSAKGGYWEVLDD
jgi:ATP-dependent DNA helicase RecG